MWLLYAFLSTLTASLKDVSSKTSLKKLDIYLVSWALKLLALPVLLPLLCFVSIPGLDAHYWMALVLGNSLYIINNLFYMKAVQSSDISLVIPITAFTPVCVMIVSPVIVHEFPPVIGVAGILLVAVGAYILNIKKRKEGALQPLKVFWTDKGSRYMLAVPIITGIASNIDKVGVRHSSAVFWVITSHVFCVIVMIPLVLWKSRSAMTQLKKNVLILSGVGVFSGLSLLFQMIAINLTLVSYVISVKRSTILFAVMFGYLFFKEKDIRSRLLGALLMLAGILVITLLG